MVCIAKQSYLPSLFDHRKGTFSQYYTLLRTVFLKPGSMWFPIVCNEEMFAVFNDNLHGAFGWLLAEYSLVVPKTSLLNSVTFFFLLYFLLFYSFIVLGFTFRFIIYFFVVMVQDMK